MNDKIKCRPGCGACCIAPSISSALPGMPGGKPAGVRCPQLSKQNLCSVYGMSERPRVCDLFQPSLELCGSSRAEALKRISRLESLTKAPISGDPPEPPC